MDEVLQYLRDNPTFYLASVEDGRPRVRPLGAVLKANDRLYFITNSQKNIYRQLQQNSCMEITTSAADGSWLRLDGEAVFDDDPAVIDAFFERYPNLADLYGSPDNPIVSVFYISEATAVIASLDPDQPPSTYRWH